jgi:hypothetical protein
MKILKRNYGHRNLIVFLVLSLVYLQAIASLSHGNSLFSLLNLRAFFMDHYLIFALSVITGFMVVKLKKYSQIALLVCLIIIVGKSFILLSDSFNKLTLVLNFIYLVFAFYFFVSWELEVELASFNPKFSSQDLEKETRFKLTALISTNQNEENSVAVHVTNIDEESCFLLLPKENTLEINPSKKYFLDSYYEGVHFKHEARLVSSYDRGIGLVFDRFPDARVSWSELYKVCLERGIVG